MKTIKGNTGFLTLEVLVGEEIFSSHCISCSFLITTQNICDRFKSWVHTLLQDACSIEGNEY